MDKDLVGVYFTDRRKGMRSLGTVVQDIIYLGECSREQNPQLLANLVVKLVINLVISPVPVHGAAADLNEGFAGPRVEKAAKRRLVVLRFVLHLPHKCRWSS